jgi:peptide/nickel transport system ATP-binding protein
VQETRCTDEEPALRPLDGHLVACHFAEDVRDGRIKPHARRAVLDPGLQQQPLVPPVGLDRP